MRILVTYPLSPQLVQAGLGDLIVYRPELAAQPETSLRDALIEHLPDATLINTSCPEPATLAAWRRGIGRSTTLVCCHRSDETLQVSVPGVAVERIVGTPSNPRDDLQALGLAERSIMHLKTERRLASCGISPGATGSLAGSSVTLVGAGIVNLITALELVEKGAQVEVLDGSPDPRGKPDWRQLGTTHGGDNARMFCFTEANSYNEKCLWPHANMHRVLGQTITEGGWLAVEPGQFDQQERTWLQRFHALPRWRAEVFAEDIHGFTVAGYPLWRRLQRDATHLFDDVGFTPGILQLYAQADRFEAATALHTRLDSLERVLDHGELCRRHPACREAVESGQIAGGLEVRGFTLSIHDFVERLLAHLERCGVRIRWNRRVTAVNRSDDGRVSGLQTVAGVIRADHYILSPGVYGGQMLEGTRTAGKIQGILGLWLSIPNTEPHLDRSIKLHREGHVGEDSNVNLAMDASGRPILIMGAGYGYLGSHPLDMESAEVERLFEALEETARRYFPSAYAEGMRNGTIHDSRKACVRPFTATGLGVFETSATAGGGRMVIASGHNTGGFAQAPAVAQATTATLEGKTHSMQALYDPERGIRSDALMD